MSELSRIADLLDQGVRGRPYHGPSVLAVLRPVTRDLALRRASPSLHTIWELVAHMGAEFSYARSLIDGSATPWIEGQTTWPAIVDTSDAAWRSTIRDLEEGHRDFLQFLAQWDDEVLDQPAVRGQHSVYAVLHGVIQHCAYHAGQIAVLARQGG